mgnify:CR=1 FL=1
MRPINADELMKRILAYPNEGPVTFTTYVAGLIVDNVPTLEVVPMDFHERCLDLEIKRRFEVEKKVPRWRSVKDELPQPGEVVLVFAEAKFESLIGGTYAVCHQLEHCDGKRSWAEPWEHFSMYFEITHWMPSPEPPKEDEDETDGEK